MLMPGGSGYSIGCENPSVKTTEFFFDSARYPTPTISSSRVKPSVTPLHRVGDERAGQTVKGPLRTAVVLDGSQ